MRTFVLANQKEITFSAIISSCIKCFETESHYYFRKYRKYHKIIAMS